MNDNKNIADLDTHLSELGLTRQATLLNTNANLKWQGSYKGRVMSILLSRRTKTVYHGEHIKQRAYISHQVVIETPINLLTRFSASRLPQDSRLAQKLKKLFDLKKFEAPTQISLKDLSIYSCDFEWCQKFISDGTVLNVLNGSLFTNSDISNLIMTITPLSNLQGVLSITCRMDVNKIDTKSSDLFLESVLSCANAAEQLRPSVRVSITRFEKFARQRPFALVIFIFLAIMAASFLVVMFLLAAVMSGVGILVVPLSVVIAYLLYRRYLK